MEFITVAKDDIIAFPKVIHRTYPGPVEKRMGSALKPFTNKALDVNMTVLSVLEKKLGLKNGEQVIQQPNDGRCGQSSSRQTPHGTRMAQDYLPIRGG